MKRITPLLLVCCMLCALLSGCGSKEKEAYVPTGDALLMEGEDPAVVFAEEKEAQEVALAYDPSRSMNPLIGYNLSNRVLFSLIYQGLFAVDSSNEPYPILCSSWQVTPDNKTYTFYVETGAAFSDGTRLTVNDVVATYEAAQKSSYYKGRFTHVVRFYASDDGGITFELDTAYQNFAVLLDIPIVKAGEVEAEFPLGSGPYAFSEGIGGAHLSKVRTWWCDRAIPVTADSVALVEVSDQTELRDEFEFGDVSLACANPMSDSYANFRCDYELWEVDSGVFLYIGVNVGYSDYFKDSDTLRKALTYAIDRATLIEENYRGMAYSATLAASPGSPYYSESLAQQYEYDSMKFIDAISGFQIPKDDDGKQRKLKLLVNSDDSARLRTARDIADALTELGIPCGTLEYGSTGKTTYEQVLRAATYDIYLGQTRLPANMDLSEFFRPYGNLGWGGITDQTIYKLNLQALENSGNYYNLLQAVAEDAKIIPVLFGYNTVYAERGVFDDMSPSRDNAFFYTLGKTLSGTQIATVYN